MPDQPRLVCVGRLCKKKGHLLLIEAADQLVAEGLPFMLVLVGDGPLRTEIETMITRLGLQDHVEITGWASNNDVQQNILASWAMVLPSFAEGLQVVVMEALALSRSVISTYVAGIPEMVEPGICRWLVPPRAVEALTNAMRPALQLAVEKLEQMDRVAVFRVVQWHTAAIEANKLQHGFGLTSKSPRMRQSMSRRVFSRLASTMLSATDTSMSRETPHIRFPHLPV